MKKFYASFAFVLFLFANVHGQFDATITFTDDLTAQPVENVQVILDGQFLMTDASGQVTFTNLSDGTYSYDYSVSCYMSGIDNITIAGGNAVASVTMAAANNVFFFVGFPLTLDGAFVELTNEDGYYQSLTTGSGGPFGNDIMTNVPFGDYTYTITKSCYETVTGTVTVFCDGDNGMLVEANPAPANNVFFFVGSPLTLDGAFVELTNEDGYYQSLTTGSGGPFGNDIMTNVPFGDYTYTITKSCYETVTGTVTVFCDGDNGMLVEANPAPANNVFFFVGSPLTLDGAFVELTNEDGYYQSLTTGSGGPFGNDIMTNVPFGDYTYTITKSCYETVTGTVTVFCDGDNGMLVEANPAPANNVFFFVGSPMTLDGAFVELTNEDGYYQSLTTGSGGPFGNDIMTNVPFGDYTYTITKSCYETVTGTVTVFCDGDNGMLVEANPAPANNVFFFVGSPMTLDGAFVELTNEDGYYQSLTTGSGGPFGNDIMTNVPFGDYTYTITKSCYETVTGTVTVFCDGDNGMLVEANPAPANNVFFFVGSPMTLDGAFVELTNEDGYYQSLTTGSGGPFGNDIMTNVPFGDYTYTITKSCYETVTGTVTVFCDGDNGMLVEANPAPANNVFFFVGSPMTLDGAFVELTNEDGYYQSLTTGSGGPFSNDVMTNVPFGDYTYTITTPCYETVTGTVTVFCDGDNGMLVEANPAPANNVFFFVGSPMTLDGAFVELTNEDGYYQSLTTGQGGPFGNDIMTNVPFGDYTYTITKSCYETVTGTVTVFCDGDNGMLVEANPAPANNVFFFVGSPMTLDGAFVELTNEDGYYQSLTTGQGGPFSNDVMTNVPFGDYTYTITTPCYETVTGTVTVFCDGDNGMLVEANPAPANNVFFFVGSPMTLDGAFVELTNEDGYYQSLTTGQGGPFSNDVMTNVPFGDYTYTITTPCYETVTGTVTVFCDGDNGMLVEANPAPIVIDNSVSQNANVLTADADGYSYQWVDCDNENAPIEGETEQSFTATVDGNYAVIISSENCSTVSACVEVIGTGIFENQPSIEVVAFPNPAVDNLKIKVESVNGKVTVRLLSLSVQIIMNESYTGTELIQLNVSDLASGTYILNVSNNQGVYTTPFVKQ